MGSKIVCRPSHPKLPTAKRRDEDGAVALCGCGPALLIRHAAEAGPGPMRRSGKGRWSGAPRHSLTETRETGLARSMCRSCARLEAAVEAGKIDRASLAMSVTEGPHPFGL